MHYYAGINLIKSYTFIRLIRNPGINLLVKNVKQDIC